MILFFLVSILDHSSFSLQPCSNSHINYTSSFSHNSMCSQLSSDSDPDYWLVLVLCIAGTLTLALLLILSIFATHNSAMKAIFPPPEKTEATPPPSSIDAIADRSLSFFRKHNQGSTCREEIARKPTRHLLSSILSTYQLH
jgi:hypothetical protein